MVINLAILLMIIGLSAHAAYTDYKRFEIENYGILFGTPIVWLMIGTGMLNKTILTIKTTTDGFYIVENVPLTFMSSLISFLIIFGIFYVAPVGGGDMKFLAFISAYFGVFETIGIFVLGSFFMLVIHFATAKKYMREKPELFDGLTTIRQKILKVMKRQVPLFVGMGPAVIAVSIYFIYNIFS